MKLTFKFGFLVLLLFFGMLMGMNIAEKGIYRIAGNLAAPESFQVKQNSNKYEVTVMGKTYTKEITNQSSTRDEKPEETMKEKTQNIASTGSKTKQMSFISRLGNTLGSFVQLGADKGLHYIASFFH